MFPMRLAQDGYPVLLAAQVPRRPSSILRIDDTWTNNKAPGTWKKQGLSAALSSEQSTVGPKGKTSKRPLYMELTLRDG